MNNKLKAVQILEIMLDNDLNNRKVFDQSDDTIYNGEEWLHIDEALAELNNYVKIMERKLQQQEVLIKGKDAMLDTYEKFVFLKKDCVSCKHYSQGTQPDGLGWCDCYYNFQCATLYEDNWEAKDE